MNKEQLDEGENLAKKINELESQLWKLNHFKKEFKEKTIRLEIASSDTEFTMHNDDIRPAYNINSKIFNEIMKMLISYLEKRKEEIDIKFENL